MAAHDFRFGHRDNSVTEYADGQIGDGLAVIYRGEITRTARECQIQPGRVTVKYGFSGRVLLGPRGKPMRVTLPVHIFVTDTKAGADCGRQTDGQCGCLSGEPDRLFLTGPDRQLQHSGRIAAWRVRGLRWV